MQQSPYKPAGGRLGRSTLLLTSLLALALLPFGEAASQQGGGRTRRNIPPGGSPGGSAGVGAGEVGPGTLNVPLSQLEVPMPPDIEAYIKDMDAAVALGKALFWDIQAGSDGMTACATCHYNGGADARTRNQMYDGPDAAFHIFDSGRGGVNTKLSSSDFPFHRLSNPNDADSTVLQSVDDIHGSAGVPMRIFEGINPGQGIEDGRVVLDPTYSISGCNLDQTTGRNAPTVINAIFFVRQFWDGRADYRFNGVNNWGDQDPDARVLKTMPDGTVQEVKISIDKASLASQAVGPIGSNIEMAWADDEANGVVRGLPVVARKLLPAAPLKLQHVHPEDVHIGSMSNSPMRGMTPGLTYEDMVKAAFVDEWWNGAGSFNGFSHMERNFSLFWGLAIQMYEAQLVSDQSPFDRYEAGDQTAMTEQELRGMSRFMSGGAACADCHAGTEFAGGTWSQLEDALTGERLGVERMDMHISGQQALIGLTNVPAPQDPQVIGHDSFWYADNLSMGHFVQVIRPDTGQALVQANIPHTGCGLDAAGEPVETETLMLPGPGMPNLPVDPEEPEPPAEFAMVTQAFGQLPDGSCALRIIIEGDIDFEAGTPAGDYPVLVNGQEVAVITLGEALPPAVYDSGFYNIGVRPTDEDLGIGGVGPFGPLSFARRIQAGEASAMEWDLPDPVQAGEFTAVNGGFKASSLRNIALTGPYMHNGSMATLEQVVQFYARGVDFLDPIAREIDPGVDGIGGLRNKPDEQAALVAFMANALLDPRVRDESGPFSHPSLPRKVGAVGSETMVLDSNGDGEADVLIDEVPSTGANGGRIADVFIETLAPGVHVSVDQGETLFPVQETDDPSDLLHLHEEGSSGCGILGLVMDSSREVRVNLTKRPTDTVSISWSITDGSELGALEEDPVTHEPIFVTSGELVFTTEDWFHPQVILLGGIQDSMDDGHQGASLLFDPFVTSDPDYAGWALDPLHFTVEDTTSIAGEMFVDASAGPGFGNGSEAHPYRTLAEALSCGVTADRIFVAAGVYAEDLLLEHTQVHIVAAPGAILQGSGQRPVIEVRGSGASGSTISGLTITGGFGEAGGIMVTNGSGLSLEGCTLTGNSGGTAGGMLVRNGSTASLVGCTFTDNSSTNGPGGLMIEGSTVTVSGCVFENNTGREGGALMVRNQGSPTIEDSSFSGNVADQGGCLFLDGADVTLTRCSIVGNSGAVTGGAVYARNGCTLTLDGTKLTNNTAPTGGGVSLDNAELVAVRSTLATNGESIFIINTGSVSLNSSILWDGGAGTSVGTSTNNGFDAEAVYSIVDSQEIDGDDTVLTTDPLFLDAGAGDHGVQSGSPAIDSGDPALGSDPDGSAPDMGSHPYQGQ